MPFGALSVQGVVQLSLPKLASAPGGTDVTCTGVPGALGPLKLGILTLGKLKLGILGSAPQPARAAQLSAKAIARRIIVAPKTVVLPDLQNRGFCGFNLVTKSAPGHALDHPVELNRRGAHD